VGGVVTAALDLAGVVGALVVARRLVLAEAPGAAAAVSLAALAVLAGLAVPGWRRVRAEANAPDAAAPVERALARAIADASEVGDRLLIRRGFPLGARFLLRVDRDVEMIDALPTVAEVDARRARDPHELVLYAEPLPEGEAARLAPLLQRHPGTRLGRTWLVDLRRFEPGVESFSVAIGAGFGATLVAQPREALDLDVQNGVWPSRDRLPDVDVGQPNLPPATLVAYANMLNADGEGPARDRARARLLQGFAVAPRFMDPAPLGTPVGVRWAARERRLDVVWEHPGAALAPPSAGAPAEVPARFVLRPADRDWARSSFERAVARPFGAAAVEGALALQSFTLKPPFKGRFHVGLLLLGEGKPRRPLAPAPVELGTIDNR
jgi:hypothetical protein